MVSQVEGNDDNSELMVRSVAKAFGVLECFRHTRNTLTLGQIAAQTGYTKSAVQRSVHTLLELGYLSRDANGGLKAGLKCLDLAFQFLHPNPLISAAYPVLLKIRDMTGERTNLSLFDGTTLVYAIRLQSTKDYIYVSSLIGRRVPTFCTAGGRAMLAELPRDEAIQIISSCSRHQLTPQTTTDVDEIIAKIDEARSNGFASVVGETIIGEVAVAAAVVVDGRPVGAVHLSSNISHCEPGTFASQYAPLVIEAAHTLSDSMSR